MPNQKPVFPSHTMSPRILLGPGPSMAHPRVLALPDAIAAASPARQEELCRIVVQQVVVIDRRVETIVWTPPARPFFEKQRECPQGDSNP
jgi:hypothetical protein